MKDDERTASINHLQCELKDILSIFVNGGFSKSGYALYPFVKDVSKLLVKKLNSLVSFAESRDDTNGLDFSCSLDKYKNLQAGIASAKNFALILSALYRDFDNNKKAPNTNAVSIKSNLLNEKEYRSDYLKPVIDLKKFSERSLKRYVIDVHVHGSLATLDYVKGWSDFDTLVIIKKDSIEDPSKLLELRDLLYKSRKFLCRIDPLQHHGHIILTEYDFGYYCQTFFPIALFKYSKSLLNAKKFQFRLRGCHEENIKKFKWFGNYFKNTALNNRNRMNSYDLKFFLHAVTLFPAMYLQAKGLHMYKKFSFDAAKKEFSKKEWDVIDYVSSLRKKWKSPKNFSLIAPYAEINPLPAYQLNSKLLDISSSSAKLNRIDIKRIARGMSVLADSAEKKILAK